LKIPDEQKGLNFCTNCGNRLTDSDSSVCNKCFYDPLVPFQILDEKIIKIKSKSKNKEFIESIRFPGEAASLVFSIFLLFLSIIVFATLSLGLFIFFLFAGLIIHRINEKQVKNQLIRLSNKNYNHIYILSKLAAYRLNMPLIPVFIKAGPTLNAYTSGLLTTHWIVLNSALIEKLNKDELLYVIGHEMGHIKCNHANWLHLMAPANMKPIPVISEGLKIIFNNWSIKAEYSADRAGLIACKNLKSCISALCMVHTGSRNIDVDSMLEEKQSSRYLKNLSELFNTHPFFSNRIKKIISFEKRLNYG
jgi:Zn-dependent protease with chaperone function